MERRTGSSWMWAFPLVLALAVGVLVWGVVRMAMGRGEGMILAAGCIGVIVALASWAIAMAMRSGRQESQASIETYLAPVNERLQHMSVLLHQVTEQQLISERAKAIAFRDRERDALRRAIREEMGRKDWDASLVLAQEIESGFGYAQEADQFRAEIQAQRNAEVRRIVGDGAAIIDKYCRAEQWTQAMREAERMLALFPHDEQAQGLPADVERRRQEYKQKLRASWDEAVSRHDVDASIDILKRLDLYLTPQEAIDMQETARQVFKDKLLMLGQQFTLTVKEHRWNEAIRLGETISAEFPNSRMAQEVREKMDLLKKRASELVLPKV